MYEQSSFVLFASVSDARSLDYGVAVLRELCSQCIRVLEIAADNDFIFSFRLRAGDKAVDVVTRVGEDSGNILYDADFVIDFKGNTYFSFLEVHNVNECVENIRLRDDAYNCSVVTGFNQK